MTPSLGTNWSDKAPISGYGHDHCRKLHQGHARSRLLGEKELVTLGGKTHALQAFTREFLEFLKKHKDPLCGLGQVKLPLLGLGFLSWREDGNSY